MCTQKQLRVYRSSADRLCAAYLLRCRALHTSNGTASLSPNCNGFNIHCTRIDIPTYVCVVAGDFLSIAMSRQTAGTHRADTASTAGTWFQGMHAAISCLLATTWQTSKSTAPARRETFAIVRSRRSNFFAWRLCIFLQHSKTSRKHCQHQQEKPAATRRKPQQTS